MLPHIADSPSPYPIDAKTRRKVIERHYFLSALILEFLLFLYFSYFHYNYFYTRVGVVLSLALIIFLSHPRKWGMHEQEYRTLLFIFPAPFLLLLQAFFIAYFDDVLENLVILIPVMLISVTTLYFAKPVAHIRRADVTLLLLNLYLITTLIMYINFFRHHYLPVYHWYLVMLITAIMPYTYLYSFLQPSKNALMCLLLSILFYFMSWSVLSALSYHISLDNIPQYYSMVEWIIVFLVNPLLAYFFSWWTAKTNK